MRWEQKWLKVQILYSRLWRFEYSTFKVAGKCTLNVMCSKAGRGLIFENWIRRRKKEPLARKNKHPLRDVLGLFWSFIALILEIPLSTQSNKATDLRAP